MNDPIHIPDSDEDLLKECKVDTFRAGGKGKLREKLKMAIGS